MSLILTLAILTFLLLFLLFIVNFHTSCRRSLFSLLLISCRRWLYLRFSLIWSVCEIEIVLLFWRKTSAILSTFEKHSLEAWKRAIQAERLLCCNKCSTNTILRLLYQTFLGSFIQWRIDLLSSDDLFEVLIHWSFEKYLWWNSVYIDCTKHLLIRAALNNGLHSSLGTMRALLGVWPCSLWIGRVYVLRS